MDDVREHMKPWNLDETRKQISSLYGRDQLDLAKACLRSIDDRMIYARVHYQDAIQLIESYINENLKESSLLEALHLGSEQGSTDFNLFIRKVGAYLVACIQSIHTLPDILAHAIYYSLAINLTEKPIKERDITATSVAKRLSEISDAEPVRLLLTELGTGGTFPHLSALANHSKHRSIIFPSMSEDWTGLREERHIVMLSAFEYDGTFYAQVSAKEFLVAESDRCFKLVIQAGNALNAVLRSRAPYPVARVDFR